MNELVKLRERMERYARIYSSDTPMETLHKFMGLEALLLDTLETLLNEKEKQAAAQSDSRDLQRAVPMVTTCDGSCSVVCMGYCEAAKAARALKEFGAKATQEALQKEADVYAIPRASKLRKQVGGDHYVNMAIQPLEYILANNIPFAEGAAIKYISRWRNKGGIQDLKKAIQTLEVIIEHEEAKAARDQA